MTATEQGLAALEAAFAAGVGGGLPAQQAGPIGGYAAPTRQPLPAGGFADAYRGTPPPLTAYSYGLPQQEQAGDSAAGGWEPYYEGADFDMLRNMSTEELARFQDAAVANGLTREIVPGHIDDGTISGMQTLMALGNRQSTSWQTVLDGIVEIGGVPGSGAGGDEFDPKPYLAPDYATLAQQVKSTFRQRLGREPDQAEMAELVGELQGWNKGAYDAEVQYGQAQFDDDDGIPGVEEPPQELDNVDPVSRFQELFDERYSGEIDFREDQAAAPGRRASVQGAMDTISQMNRTSF